MSSYKGRITAKLVSNHYWCPALAWLKVHGPGIAWSPPHFTAEHARLIGYDDLIGSILRDAVEKLAQDCEITGIYREKRLWSSALRVSGSIDALVTCRDKNIIIEAKLRHPRRDDPAYVQAGVYMILAEHNDYRGVEAYIASPENIVKVNNTWIITALKEIRETHKTLSMNSPPPPKRPSITCRTCIYRRVCPYS
ncbi:MAG: Dna2/Cas4 domain-containing protein [Desulfurococcales archaeon]|nr:Dna2/Cas4 domain-containing protein [Desulfurococcales archaeon]